jgi:hypothetical protein
MNLRREIPRDWREIKPLLRCVYIIMHICNLLLFPFYRNQKKKKERACVYTHEGASINSVAGRKQKMEKCIDKHYNTAVTVKVFWTED